GRNNVVPTAAIAAITAPTAPPTAPPIPNPSAACVRVCSANSLLRVESDISTLISSRVKPRFMIASTAASAPTLLLKSPVTNFALDITILPQQAVFDSEYDEWQAMCRPQTLQI